MAFDETPTYAGAIAAGDDGTPNLMNSLYLQRAVFASRPAAGNAGVMFISTNGIGGTGVYPALYRDNGTTWDLIGIIPSSDLICRIFTGSYTGDGATSLAITGVGFAPKVVWIFERTPVSANALDIFTTTTEIMDDNAAGGAVAWLSSSTATFNSDQIIALGADGFTVDDAGVDFPPNANGIVYNYMCLG